MGNSEVLERRGDLRVVLFHDDQPHAPSDDGSSPLLRLWMRSYEWRAEHVSEITSFKPDGIDGILAAAARWGYRSGRERFERYLRIFHGTTEVLWWDSRGNGGGDYVYVTFDTRQWREFVGCPADQTGVLDLSEWQSYCEGDVWGRRVERRRSYVAADGSGDTIETWEPVQDADSWGLIGREWAEQEAREALAAEAA